ncbi:hypothetical protein [Roseovarius autotrophicus]|uniref:hypothetical protein n=1 Tax=Roseovarius autotrophicus TaxID=2824121 RepID=UPI001B38F03F|nr:hypothetical protein [Roseovarius autotrophicus]
MEAIENGLSDHKKYCGSARTAARISLVAQLDGLQAQRDMMLGSGLDRKRSAETNCEVIRWV